MAAGHVVCDVARGGAGGCPPRGGLRGGFAPLRHVVNLHTGYDVGGRGLGALAPRAVPGLGVCLVSSAAGAPPRARSGPTRASGSERGRGAFCSAR